MALDPRLLTFVLAVVEYGTFNRAAKELGISQPALSKNIALIERRLGTKVFERGARGATLTEAGKVIARSAHNLRFILARAQQEIAGQGRIQGPLVIGATPSMVLGLIPEALARLQKRQPKLLITVTEGLDDWLRPALLRGEIDLLIGPLEDRNESSTDIEQERLAQETFEIAFPAGHRLADAREVHLAELRNEAWVLPIPGSSFHRTVEACFVAAGIPWPSDVVESNTLHSHDRLVLLMDRIAFVSRAQLILRRTDVRVVPLAGAPTRLLGVRRRAGIELPALAEFFIEELRHVFRAAYATPRSLKPRRSSRND